MGSGKTTVGKLLSESLKQKFIDTDNEILELSAELSVPDIFEKHGEHEFRRLETAVAEKISGLSDDLVVATGGGMIINQKNQSYLRINSKIILLDTNFENIQKRVEAEMQEKSMTRPLFSDIEQARTLFETRAPVYQSVCDIKVSTNDKSPQQITQEIIATLQNTK